MLNRKKMLFLVNPHAGKAAIRGHLLSIVDIFSAAGYLVTLYTSQRAGEIPAMVRDCGEDYDIIVGSGGDGTMNEVINGVMACPRKPILGYIPAGTTNDFASSLRLPRGMAEAAQAIVSGVPTFFDVGRFNQSYFSYVAAFGAFTDVTYQTPQEYKNLLGRLAYLLEGATRLPLLRPRHIRVEHDDGVIEDDILLGIVTNSAFVAGLPVGRLIDTSMNDGVMEVFLVRNPTTILDISPVVNKLILGEIDRRHVHVLRTRKLKLECDEPIPWTLDGEYGGDWRDANIENLCCALRLMVPADSLEG